MKFLARRKPDPLPTMELNHFVDTVASQAISLAPAELKLDLAAPNMHTPALSIPLVGQTTICILNDLLPLLPGNNRVIRFSSTTSGDTLYEQLHITFGVVTIRMNIIGVYVNWDLEFDPNANPSSADSDTVALALSSRLSKVITEVIESHVGLKTNSKH